jgi:serine/threonine-protein kinase
MGWLSDRTLEHLQEVADWPDLSATRYEALEVLGRGGMATVYLARDRELQREVAIKVLKDPAPTPDAIARLRREARILAGLEHPGLVPVHDVGELPDGRVFYVMRRVRGQRLDERLREVGSVPARLRVFERVCDAVAFAHSKGVIHRDLKPENVMIGPFGEVLVLDFGVAKLRGDAGSAAATTGNPTGPDTAHGTVVGTPGFMSPEQARGLSVDARADVYALGTMLHLMLTDRLPEEAEGSASRSARAVPRPLASILARALASDPERRYPGARELGDDVSSYLSGLRVTAHREGFVERAVRVAAKYKTPIALIVAYMVMRIVLILVTGR